MTEQELRKQIDHLQLVVKRLVDADISGDFASAFRASGLEFAQLRNYIPGDEVRSIDWKSSAKMNRLMVKEFVQERERTVFIALDISASLECSSQHELKQWHARMTAASLALIAQKSNDKVGLILFSDKVTHYLPPRKGRGHGGHIVRTIFAAPHEKGNGDTGIKAALDHLASRKEKKPIVFIISDWIADPASYQPLLAVIGRKYEAVAVRIIDALERHMPDLGVLPTIDPETGETVLVNTGGKALAAYLNKRLAEQKQLFRRYKLATLDVDTAGSFVDALTTFFHGRSH
jgi:uncharacterized protein (DUF58 family)